MPGHATSPLTAGLFGKLPGRGDFVRVGLPGSFVTPWDAWVQHVLPISQQRVSDWLGAWLEAPVWNFLLPAGACGPQGALGLFLPSVDRVGRYFPLALVRLAPDADVSRDAARFLAAAEQAGRAAIAEDLSPARVMELLAAPAAAAAPDPPSGAPGCTLWWTEGGPRREAGTLSLPGLPDAETFAGMIAGA